MNISTIFTALTLALGCLAMAGPAGANDAKLGLSSGGLVFEQADTVAMMSEKLVISPDLIRVAYTFASTSGGAETLKVGFPLPRLNVLEWLYGDVIVPEKADDFVRFSLWIDDEPQPAKLLVRAYLGDEDRTADLEAIGLSPSPFGPDFKQSLDQAREHWGTELISEQGFPLWDLVAAYAFDLAVPAEGLVSVRHSYAPVTGSAILSPPDEGMPAPRSPEAAWAKDYCVEKEDWIALGGLACDKPVFIGHDIAYRLVTGALWDGPIRQFDLELEGPFASLCQFPLVRDGSVYRFTATDFVPSQDLKILFAVPVVP